MRISDWSSDVCSSDLAKSILQPIERTRELDFLAKLILVDDVACKGREPAGEQIGRSVVVAERVHLDAAPRGRALQDRGIREFIFENTRRAMGARFTLGRRRSEEHTSELQYLMRISYAFLSLN